MAVHVMESRAARALYLTREGWLRPVWPEENHQMSIKVVQKWFQLKNDIFWHLYKKMHKNVGDWGKFIVAKGFKKLPKVQKIAQSGHTGRDQLLALQSTHYLPIVAVHGKTQEQLSAFYLRREWLTPQLLALIGKIYVNEALPWEGLMLWNTFMLWFTTLERVYWILRLDFDLSMSWLTPEK